MRVENRTGRNSSLEKLFNGLNTQTCSYNTVKFSSFRIALKVRALITKFKLSYVDYKIALFQLNQEGIAFGRQFMIPMERARHIIQSIYQSLAPVHFADISINDLTEGLCAVFSRILDDDRSNEQHFDSDSFKLVFFALLNMNLTLKYMYLYQMLCFPSATISVSKIRLLFTVLAKIAQCLDNSTQDIESSAETLVDGLVIKANRKEIDKSTFLDFLNDRPIGLEWMHSMHLLLSCATVRHEAQCDVCGTYPIIGLRFRCLSCFDYDLCATCHLLGSFSKDHLPGHQIQQLIKQVTPIDDFKAFVEILRGRLLRNKIFSSKYKALTLNRTNSENSSIDNQKCHSLSGPIKLDNTFHSLSKSQEIRSNRIYRPISRCNILETSINSEIVPRITSQVDDEIDSHVQCNYDNVPSLQEVVRSVEMTNIYDRYVNISSTVISTHHHSRHNFPPSTSGNRVTGGTAWRVFSRTTEPILQYQNIRRQEHDPLLLDREEVPIWDNQSREDYGLLPESQSSSTVWNYRLAQSNL